jgi:hypothetical protein
MNVQKRASYGSVLHEFGHVLGLMHEHQRQDRGDFISISPFLLDYLKTCMPVSAVCKDVLNAFPTISSQMHSAYDLCSLMHYLQNQAPRHPSDSRWSQIFGLTDNGKSQLKTCAQQFSKLAPKCQKIGQKCAISISDADIVRRFHSLK